jgi:eukaryotic-like serine/threonine-protein kinase
MASSGPDSQLKVDSTRKILEDWNVNGEDDGITANAGLTTDEWLARSQSASAAFSWARLGADDGSVPPRPSEARRASGQSVELFAGFGLDESGMDWGSTRAHVPAMDPAQVSAPQGAEPHRRAEPQASGSGPPGGLPQPGDELAGFRIIMELGRGAFARVYLAEEINLGRRLVAIKVSRPDGDEPQILARLQHTHIVPVHSVCDDPVSGLRVLCMPYFGGANLAQVLEAAGGLVPTRHDGRSLVKALDQISHNRSSISHKTIAPFSSCRLRPSRSSQTAPAGAPALSTSRGGAAVAASRFRSLLSRLVRPRATVPACPGEQEQREEQDQPSRQFLHSASAIQAAVWIVARLADGLEHAHSRGLLHRDLKPANVLLAGDGTPMLLDFNLAADVRPERGEGEIRRALIGGTLPYMSPEHLDAFNLRGSTAPEAVDERSDIYALGLLLFEMLAGEHPFPEPVRENSLVDTIELMIAGRRQVPSLRARCPQIPWSLDALVTKCLSFDPGHRYDRAHDLAEDLRRYLEYLPMKHGPEPSARERIGKWGRRHPALCGSTSIALISLVLLVLLGATVALVYDRMQGLAARVMIRVFERDFT